MFIVDYNDQIVLYDIEKDKWDRVQGPTERGSDLCGIGSWNDCVFASIHTISRTCLTCELVGMDNPEWKTLDAMPTQMYSWLIDGAEDYNGFRIEVSYCSKNLLIWDLFNSSAKRFVLGNLAHKTWEKLELPRLPLTMDLQMNLEPWNPSMHLTLDMFNDGFKDKGKGKDKDKFTQLTSM